MRVVRLLAALLALAPITASAQPSAVAASGVVHWRDLDLPVEFHAAGDFAVLTARLPDGRTAPLREVASPDDAVAILADERLAFVWPALLQWAGADLTALRDRGVARAQVADSAGLVGSRPRSTAEQYAGSATTVATLQLETALWRAGRRNEAAAVLRRRLAALPTRPVPGEDGYARVAIGDRLATRLFESGDLAGAQALIEQLRADPGIAPEMRLNADVNAALIAARAGQSQAALVLISAALTRFRGQPDDAAADNVKIPDSEAHFAWIKACALAGLGHRDQAAAVMRGIAPSPEVTTDMSQRARALSLGYRCMGDAAGLARELARELADAPPGADVFAALQPDEEDYAPDRATMAAALRDPVLTAAMKGRARLLPAMLRPATAGWRQGAGALDGSAAAR